jgi:hypothetical protein
MHNGLRDRRERQVHGTERQHVRRLKAFDVIAYFTILEGGSAELRAIGEHRDVDVNCLKVGCTCSVLVECSRRAVLDDHRESE